MIHKTYHNHILTSDIITWAFLGSPLQLEITYQKDPAQGGGT